MKAMVKNIKNTLYWALFSNLSIAREQPKSWQQLQLSGSRCVCVCVEAEL